MNKPIKHHYIPQFYLRRWINPSKTLFVYIRGKTEPSEIKRNGLTGFCLENGLYSIPNINPNNPTKIETEWASPLDGCAATIINKFNEGQVNNLTDDERLSWANFCASLWLRSPQGLKYISEKLHQNPLSLLNSKEENRDLCAFILPKLDYLKHEVVFTALNWYVERTDNEFLIGDTLPTFNLEINSPFYTYLPIDPKRTFLAFGPQKPKFNDKLRRDFNKWIVQNAKRFVFASSRENEDFILKYLK